MVRIQCFDCQNFKNKYIEEEEHLVWTLALTFDMCDLRLKLTVSPDPSL